MIPYERDDVEREARLVRASPGAAFTDALPVAVGDRILIFFSWIGPSEAASRFLLTASSVSRPCAYSVTCSSTVRRVDVTTHETPDALRSASAASARERAGYFRSDSFLLMYNLLFIKMASADGL